MTTRTSLLFLAVLVPLLGALPAQARVSDNQAKQFIELFNEQPRAVRAGHELLPVNYVEYEGDSYGFAVSRRLARLAEAGETFRILRLNKKTQYLVIELESATEARVRIPIYSNDQVEQSLLDQVFPRVLQALFDFGAEPRAPAVVGHRSSHLYHLGTCNHLPPESLRVDFASASDATAQGMKPCRACYPHEVVLPYDHYTTTRAAAIESARLFELAHPRVDDAAIQEQVQEAGERVLERFPIGLAGFEYRFTAVHSELPNAYSFPTGFVYVTDALLDIVEDPMELEFVLAHEVAHCELLLPPVRVSKPEEAPVYPYDFVRKWWFDRGETVSDLLAVTYLNRRFGDVEVVAGAASILSKLQFFHEAGAIDEFRTHPSFADRRALFDMQKFEPFLMSPTFDWAPYLNRDQETFVVEILGRSVDENNSYVFATVEASDLVNDPWDLRSNSTLGALVSDSGLRVSLSVDEYGAIIGPGETALLKLRFGARDDFAKFDPSSTTFAYEKPNYSDGVPE